MFETLIEPTLPLTSTWAFGPIVPMSSVFIELATGVIRPSSATAVAASPPSCPDRILRVWIARSRLVAWYRGAVWVMVIVVLLVVP